YYEAQPRELQELHDLPSASGRSVETYGIVSSISQRFTRKGSKMMTMDLEPERAIVKTVGFSRTVESLESRGAMPAEGDLVRITGKVEVREYEKETTDEETGETSTEKIVERSIILDSVSSLDIEDPSQEQEESLGVVDLLLGGGDGPDEPESDPTDDPEGGVAPEWDDEAWDDEPDVDPAPVVDEQVDPAPIADEWDEPEDEPESSLLSDSGEVPESAEDAAGDALDEDEDEDNDDDDDDEEPDGKASLNLLLESAEQTDAWGRFSAAVSERGADSCKLARFPTKHDPPSRWMKPGPRHQRRVITSGDNALILGTRSRPTIDPDNLQTPSAVRASRNDGQVVIVVDPMSAVSQIEAVTKAILSGQWDPIDLDSLGPIRIRS